MKTLCTILLFLGIYSNEVLCSLKLDIHKSCSNETKQEIIKGFENAEKNMDQCLDTWKNASPNNIVLSDHETKWKNLKQLNESMAIKVTCQNEQLECGHTIGSIDDNNMAINITPTKSCRDQNGSTYMHELWHLLGEKYNSHNFFATLRPDYAVTCTYKCINQLSYVKGPGSEVGKEKMKELCLSDENPYELNHLLNFVQYYDFSYDKGKTYEENFASPFRYFLKNIQSAAELKKAFTKYWTPGYDEKTLEQSFTLSLAQNQYFMLNDIICEKSNESKLLQEHLIQLLLEDEFMLDLLDKNISYFELEENCHTQANNFISKLFKKVCIKENINHKKAINRLSMSILGIKQDSGTWDLNKTSLIKSYPALISVIEVNNQIKTYFFDDFKIALQMNENEEEKESVRVTWTLANQHKNFICSEFSLNIKK